MTRRPWLALGVAVLFVGGHLAARGLGLGAHTSAIVGMPADDGSLSFAAIHVVTYLLAVTVAPVLIIAAVLEPALAKLLFRARARR